MTAERPSERVRPVRQKSSSPGAFGLLIVIVVLLAVAGLWFATRGKAPVQAQPPAEVADPFEGLPAEEPPSKQAETKGEAAREE
jgi:hypothetical protein